MRIYTLVFSVLVHVAAIVAVYIAPAFATDELPEPPRTSAYVIVKATLPDPPPAPRREAPAPSPQAAPLQPPDGVQPERPVEPIDQPRFDDPGAVTAGGPFGSIGSVTDAGITPPPDPRPIEPIPVGGIIRPPKKVTHVAPIYPPIPLAARKGGLVILQAVIDEDGSVREVNVLRSDPLFDRAAVVAVKQWRFTPTLLNGHPVPIVMTVTVGFTPSNE
ncbi:MAG TPA: energy transducer TonB [Vicinamibacterales bacterium]|nr:energy transducer TonB [Vicinamibacterales bacterium]